MTLRYYRGGTPVDFAVESRGVCVEAVVDDGRTVQLIVTSEVEIHLRAWGNVPAKVGNVTSVSVHACVPVAEQTHDPVTYNRLPGPPPDKAAIADALDERLRAPSDPVSPTVKPGWIVEDTNDNDAPPEGA